MQKTVLIFLGPPASGKGTQASLVSEKLNIPHIALGDILREAVRKGTDSGIKAKAFMDAGKLVPDEITIAIAKERFARDDCKNGFIVDGFPRTLNQAEALENILKEIQLEISNVVYIKIEMITAVSRLSGRRSCKQCNAVYHLEFKPSKKQDICDKCDGELYQRHDDTEEVIKTRFSVYEQSTLPLVEHFSSSGKLVEVSGEGSVKEIQAKIASALNLD